MRSPATSTALRATSRPSPSTYGDLGRFDQALQALVQPVDDAVLVRVDALHVDADELGLDTELLGLARLVGDLAGVQQRLRRDAAAVQARAAELVLLDQCHRQVELCGPQRGRVTAAAATENYDVKLAHEISYDAATAPGEGVAGRFEGGRRWGAPGAPGHLVTRRRARRREVRNDTPCACSAPGSRLLASPLAGLFAGFAGRLARSGRRAERALTYPCRAYSRSRVANMS